MPLRHQIAVNCVNTNDLMILCEMLKQSIEDSMAAKQSPYTDLACRIVCHQIAFAGNGDLPFMKYYEDAYAYCVEQSMRDANNLPPEKDDDAKKPTYKAS